MMDVNTLDKVLTEHFDAAIINGDPTGSLWSFGSQYVLKSFIITGKIQCNFFSNLLLVTF